MDIAREEKLKELEEKFRALPPKWQRAVLWLIENMDGIEQMCREEPLTPAQREEMMRESISRDDVYMQVLLILEKILNRDAPAGEDSPATP